MKKPDLVKETIQTYEKTAEDYYNNSENLSNVRPLLDYFIVHIPGNNVLEIGCGPGRDANYLSEHGLTVTGIDLSEHFIAMAQRNAPRATFQLMDMRKLMFANKTFDGLWIMASFLHIPKQEAPATLRGFARLLKLGGLMYISVKSGNGEQRVKKKRYGGGIKFFALYNPVELTALIRAAGFTIVKEQLDENRFKDPFINVFATKD
ncbi:methyltransferase domain-containing protein [Candidatus Berkelbacteria bacterium]|nr:methyltransferase domain-containing protein [Candidatus Berkelbacteria bacterium]